MSEGRMASSLHAAVAVAAFMSLGCFNLFGPEPFPRPDLSGLECGEFEGSAPRLGYAWDDLEPLGSRCPDVPVEPGFQGGFHITPVVWIPEPMLTGRASGVGNIRVTFSNGETEPIELPIEVFDEFWQPIGTGRAMQTRVILPNRLVEDGGRWNVLIDFTIEFDDPNQAPISLSEETQLYLEF
jgi:hypothetical protein